MAAKKKKPEEKGAGASGSTRSMRDAAQLARIPKSSPELKGQTAEESLQESKAKFRTLFESASDAIFIMNSTVFLDCNHRLM
jgi:PAS domain-containing protein